MGGGRRRRRLGLRFVVFLLPLFVVACGAAVVASATSTTSAPPPGHHREPGPVHLSSRAPRPPQPAGSLAVALADRTINHVLAYTPFVRAGLPGKKLIALTFDDGPSPYTPAIVRELVRLHAPATFFVVGQQLDYFSAGLRDEVRHGFVVGDHTENHAPLDALGASLQYAQIHTDALRIHHLTGAWPRLFRPPYGVFNGNTMAILHGLRMLMVMWSVDPADWRRPGTNVIVARVLADARPGTIVELHDGGGDRSQTAAALPEIIKALRSRHYDFVTVPQLLAADPPSRHQRLTHLTE